MPFSSTLGNILQGILMSKGADAAKQALNVVTSKVNAASNNSNNNNNNNQIVEKPKTHAIQQTSIKDLTPEPEEKEIVNNPEKKEESDTEEEQTETSQNYLDILNPTIPALNPRIQETTARAAENKQEEQQSKSQDDFWTRLANAAAYDASIQNPDVPYGTFGSLIVSSDKMMDDLYDEAQNGGNQSYEAYYDEPLQDAEQSDDTLSEFVRNTIDDGTNNIQSRTSPWITGEEVQRQVIAGITPFSGDLSQIDPVTVYNKFDLAEKYGYRPYMPNSKVRADIIGSKEMQLPNEFWNTIARSREQLIHGNADINGKNIDTTDLEQRKVAYADNLQRENENIINSLNENRIYSTPEEAGNYALPVGRVNSFYRITVEDGAGNVIESQDIASSSEPDISWNEDGTLNFYFPDIDQSYDFNVPEDGDAFYDPMSQWTSVSPDQAEGWVSGVTGMTYDDMQGLKLSDGQVITNDELANYENGEYSRDYGPLNLGKPATQISHEEFNAEDFAPWFMDMFNSSARYFGPQGIAWAAMPSDVYMSMNNLDPQSRVAGGVSQLKEDGDINNVDYLASVGANALMPLTEKVAGNIGGRNLLNTLAKPILNKVFGNGNAKRRIADLLGGIVGEGIEEVSPGQFMEELASNGWTNAFSNELSDEEGNLIFDSTGHVELDPNTSLQDRASNFVKQIPESFMGGLLLGGTVGTPGSIAAYRTQTENDDMLKLLYGKDYVEHPEWFEPTRQALRQAAHSFVQRPQELIDLYDRER